MTLARIASNSEIKSARHWFVAIRFFSIPLPNARGKPLTAARPSLSFACQTDCPACPPDRGMIATPQNLCELLVQSRLMTSEDVSAVFQRWSAQAQDKTANVGQFTKWLVAQQYLTDYQ